MPKQKQQVIVSEPDYDAALGVDLDHSYTRKELIDLERISMSAYLALLNRGLGPVEDHYPFTKIYRITERSRREWKHRMRRLAQEEGAKLVDQRRRDQAREAGKIAAQSPLHASKTKRRPAKASSDNSPEAA
jgi:hypothetical protein